MCVLRVYYWLCNVDEDGGKGMHVSPREIRRTLSDDTAQEDAEDAVLEYADVWLKVN